RSRSASSARPATPPRRSRRWRRMSATAFPTSAASWLPPNSAGWRAGTGPPQCASIGAVGEDAVEVAAPRAVVEFEQFLGRGAARRYDVLHGAEEHFLGLAGDVLHVAGPEAGPRDLQQFRRDVAHRAFAERRGKRGARHLVAQRLALVGGP